MAGKNTTLLKVIIRRYCYRENLILVGYGTHASDLEPARSSQLATMSTAHNSRHVELSLRIVSSLLMPVLSVPTFL